MKIGTDISLAVCRCEGYMVMEYKAKELMKKGVLDKDVQVNFTVSNPEVWTDNGRPCVNSGWQQFKRNHKDSDRYAGFWIDLYALDESYSFNELLEFLNYGDRKQKVSAYADWESNPPNLDNPTPFDMLNLASDLNSYFGLQTI